MFLQQSIAIFCLFVALCNTAFIDRIEKCSIKDEECHKSLLQTILRDASKSGIPELGIPPTDPYILKNVTVTVLDLIHITMIDGVAKGVKDCVIDRFVTRIEKFESTLELTCDMIIKGKYKVEGSSPVLEDLMGGRSVHGKGVGKVTIEKLHVKFDYIYRVERINGETYFKCNYTDPKYLKYNYALGRAKFAANNLYLGDNEASQMIMNIMNENWKFIMDTFGKPFLDKAVELIYVETHKFFNNVPTKYYITEDLSEYVQN